MSERQRGPIAWMAANPVAANLLMLVFIVGGLIFALQAQQEVFPEVELDQVTVQVRYPGAGPVEVEEGILLPVEEAVRGIDGVKEVRSVARENLGVVTAELFTSADEDQALDDIKSAVDRITSFPEDAERPVISMPTNRRQVLSVVLYGDLDRTVLDSVAESLRREMLRDEAITQVEVGGLPPPEISIEVPQAELRRYGLTLPQIARRVNQASVDLPAGALETPGGEVRVRVTEEKEYGRAFRDVVLISRPDGTEVRLGDIAGIEDRFRDTDREAWFNGQPAARLQVFRVGEQTPIEVSDAVKAVVEQERQRLPQAVSLAIVDDRSQDFSARIGLLMENGRIGVLLVLLVLGLFLHPRLAFWVTLAIPICFLGVFLVLPAVDITINMISLFAFLLVLGIVVDDAIVIGEATFKQRQDGARPYAAAVQGTREVKTPVIFAVTTTIIAFCPLLFVPGVTGKFFINIPAVVIPILVISLIESLLILPAHLAEIREGVERREPRFKPAAWLMRRQHRFTAWLERFVERRYRPALERMLDFRYLTFAAGLAVLLVVAGLFLGGRLDFHFLPKIQGDRVSASIEFPFGAPIEQTRAAVQRITTAAREVAEAAADEAVVDGIYAEIGSSSRADPEAGVSTQAGAHLARVEVFLVPAAQRQISAAAFNRRWRERVGEIAGTERLAYSYSVGPTAGAAVAIELAHEDRAILKDAAEELAAAMGDFEGVHDIDDGFQVGKPRLDLTLKPAARALGITERDLAQQVRAAFFGVEAQRQQRGRDELRIYVRRPEAERDSEFHVERMIVLTPEGGEIPLTEAAQIERARSYTKIERENGRRTVTVTADVDPRITTGGKITAALERDVLPQLLQQYRGLSYELGGEQQERNEALSALYTGMTLALLAMYGLMAVVFRSYTQPLVIMLAIPFGIIGAVFGHLLLGFDFSIISLFGIVALAGVVVNDSLVLIAAVNNYRRQELSVRDALVAGAQRRFRPVLLTSLTTFFGLAPMIFETSLQARFLIPMAISLGIGVLFVTVIALVIVPAAYAILDDGHRGMRRIKRRLAN